MNQKITRRHFGQLVLAGTTIAGLGYFTNKTLAQSSKLVYGVRAGAVLFSKTTAYRRLICQSLNVGSGDIRDVSVPQVLADGTPILYPNEELSDFTILADGTCLLAITPASGSINETQPTRLAKFKLHSSSATFVAIAGLKKNQKIGNVTATNDGRVLGLVKQKTGGPPAKIVEINIQTGQITPSPNFKIPTDIWLATLAQSPDNTIYSLSIAKDGTSKLVKLDKTPVPLSPLSVKDCILNNGMQNLISLSADQLLALGACRYKTPNNIYMVDLNTGTTKLLHQFNATNIAIA